MKTPERWRPLPRCALFASILAWKTFEHSLGPSRRGAFIRFVQVLLFVLVLQHIFSTTFNTLHAEEGYPSDRDLWPMTLIFELIRDIVKVNSSAEFWVHTSIGSSVWVLTNRRTRTHADGIDFIPSTADAGSKNRMALNNCSTIRSAVMQFPLVNRDYLSVICDNIRYILFTG